MLLFGRVIVMAGVVAITATISCGQTVKRVSSQQKAAKSSEQSLLDLALYYYNNDDLSGKAEQALKKLLVPRYESSPQYETARYYLAAYYQRRFYLYRQKRGTLDWGTLKQAAAAYRQYTDKYYRNGTHTWLNDSFFNLALVYLQLGEPSNALNELSKMGRAADKDQTVYVYQIIWSPQSQDVIDSNISAARLADYAAKVVKENSNSFERAVVLIQKWCQDQRSRR